MKAVGELISEAENEVDIITFAESPDFLNLQKSEDTGKALNPVQTFILKCYYGLLLDDTERRIHVRYFPTDGQGDWMTELEYATYLMQQHRCNITMEWLDNPWRLQDLVLACGRRGGKSILAAVISCYEAYRLIVKGDPQTHYQLMRGQPIKIINLATEAKQAKELLEMIRDMVYASPWFKIYIHSSTQETLRLKTRNDIQREQDSVLSSKEAKEYHTVLIESLACSASGSRGGTVIVVILDEFAHFKDGSGNRAGGTILEAIVPSTATFGMDARILCISSPYNKGGEFYSRFRKGLGDPDKGVPGHEKPVGQSEGGIRCFRIPTWEMNQRIGFDFLNARRQSSDADDFEWEYAAEFSTSVTGFFKYPERIDVCVELSKKHGCIDMVSRQRKNVPHYITVDPSAVGHGYALCMAHIEMFPAEKKVVSGNREKIVTIPEPFVVVDRWRRWMSDDPEFEDCAETESGVKIIDPKVIENYILNDLRPVFRIAKIIYDQFESAGSVNEFSKRGIDCIRKPFTARHNMAIYRALETLIYEGRLLFANDTGTELGLDELRYLQKKRMDRKRFKVEAQNEGDVTTDDLADVLANAAFHLVADKSLTGMACVTGVGGQGAAPPKKHKSSPAASRMSNLDRLRTSNPRYNRWRTGGWRASPWSRRDP